MKYYFVGIKGTGMSALAQMLSDEGHLIHGSDVDDDFFTTLELKKRNIPIYSFSEDNIDGHSIYIIGNAFNKSNVEVNKIINEGYQYYYYHEFLGRVITKKMIAIAGTHGKTTTTSILTQMLDYQCSFIIGDGSGGSRESELLILEACEYQDHFLAYNPEITVINNIEMDHTDYFKTDDQLVNSFQKLANNSKIIIINGDDINCQKISHPHKLTVGMKSNNDYIIKIVHSSRDGYFVTLKGKNLLTTLNIPFVGIHMIYNYVMAYIVCLQLSIKPKVDKIELPKRRMTIKKIAKTIIIDDYAHHPSEIKCLYSGLKLKYPNIPLKVIFESHTYSRTLKFKKQFKDILSKFDEVYIAPVFTSKRETRNTYLDLKIKKIFKKFKPFTQQVLENIDGSNKEIWVFLGAGTIDQYIPKINDYQQVEIK